METRIFEIGRGRYSISRSLLGSFLMESKKRVSEGEPHDGPFRAAGDRAGEPCDRELRRIFEEVMELYDDYMRFESVDLLLRLKCRLQEVSVRYSSHVLASEVLAINSCLPYESRIPRVRVASGGKAEEL